MDIDKTFSVKRKYHELRLNFLFSGLFVEFSSNNRDKMTNQSGRQDRTFNRTVRDKKGPLISLRIPLYDCIYTRR